MSDLSIFGYIWTAIIVIGVVILFYRASKTDD